MIGLMLDGHHGQEIERRRIFSVQLVLSNMKNQLQKTEYTNIRNV
jgi:hypothetical protein